MNSQRILYWAVVFLSITMLWSCRFDNQGTDEPVMVRVNLKLEPEGKTANLVDSRRPTAFSSAVTSLVIAVPASTTVANDTGWVNQTFYDAQLANISNQSVTLTLPLGVPIRLVKLDWSVEHSLPNLKQYLPVADDKGISAPFTIESGTTAKTVVVDMDSVTSVPGSVSWAWTVLNGTIGMEHSHGLSLDGSGNLYFIGHTDQTFDGQPYNGGAADIFVAKYSNTGVKQWIYLVGSNGSDNGTDIVVDASGGIYITGHTTSATLNSVANSCYPDQCQFVAYYNASFVHQWTNMYGPTNPDEMKRLTLDATGYVYTIDASTDIRRFDSGGSPMGQSDPFDPVKDSFGRATGVTVSTAGSVYGTFYSLIGTTEKLLGFNSSLSLVNDISGDVGTMPEDIVLDSDGNIYVTGCTMIELNSSDGFSGGQDIYVKKLNSSFVLQWVRQWWPAANTYSCGTDLKVDTSGTVYVTGEASSDVFLAIYDTNGNLISATRREQAEFQVVDSIELGASGAIYITGYTNGDVDGFFNADSSYSTDDFFLMKFTTN